MRLRRRQNSKIMQEILAQEQYKGEKVRLQKLQSWAYRLLASTRSERFKVSGRLVFRIPSLRLFSVHYRGLRRSVNLWEEKSSKNWKFLR